MIAICKKKWGNLTQYNKYNYEFKGYEYIVISGNTTYYFVDIQFDELFMSLQEYRQLKIKQILE